MKTAEEIASGWPHPEVGRPAIKGENGYISVEYGKVLAGCIFLEGRTISEGRIYTTEEWERVRLDVMAYLDPILRDAEKSFQKLTGCWACGAGKDDPCGLDKGDGICPELNAPRGVKIEHGNGLVPYAVPED